MPIDDRPGERNLIDKIKKYQKLIDIPNSMTTVPHLIITLKELIKRRKTGVYNMVNPGTTSPAEIMQMYQRIIDPSHRFESLSLEGLNNITKANRSNCVLSTKKLKDVGLEFPEIHIALEECLINYKRYII